MPLSQEVIDLYKKDTKAEEKLKEIKLTVR